jgi:hypothetical protein
MDFNNILNLGVSLQFVDIQILVKTGKKFWTLDEDLPRGSLL